MSIEKIINAYWADMSLHAPEWAKRNLNVIYQSQWNENETKRIQTLLWDVIADFLLLPTCIKVASTWKQFISFKFRLQCSKCKLIQHMAYFFRYPFSCWSVLLLPNPYADYPDWNELNTHCIGWRLSNLNANNPDASSSRRILSGTDFFYLILYH